MGHAVALAWSTLRAASVHLGPHDPSQDDRTVAWLNSPSVQAGFGVARTFTLSGHRDWLAAHPEVLLLAIHESASDEHIGNVALTVNARHRNAYLQIYLGSELKRGRGLGRQAAGLGLAAAFAGLGLHRVWLHVLLDNPSAGSIYTALGFQGEGTERDALFLNGRWVSQRRMGILEDEWRARGGPPCASP